MTLKKTRVSSAIVTLLILITAIALGGCATRPMPVPASEPMDVTFLPEKGDFVSVEGERLSMDDVLLMARDADYILMGEGHKNICDHKMQRFFAEALAESGSSFAVGLEMVAVDKQPVLDDFAEGIVPVKDLESELEWKTRWGYPFSLFEGLFVLAQKHSIPVVGLNVPPSVIRTISRKGVEGLSEDLRDYLPESVVYPSDEQSDMLREIMNMHVGRDAGNSTQLERFMYSQSVWDSKMAEEAVRLRRKFNWPVMVIAGSGHVEHGWGIARRIEVYDPGARILSLMPWRGDDFEPAAGDVFFHCPESYTSRMGAVFTIMQGRMVVESVNRGSRAESSGLRPGDILAEANGVSLNALMDLHVAGKKAYEEGQPLVFLIERKGKPMTVNVGKLGQGNPKK